MRESSQPGLSLTSFDPEWLELFPDPVPGIDYSDIVIGVKGWSSFAEVPASFSMHKGFLRQALTHPQHEVKEHRQLQRKK